MPSPKVQTKKVNLIGMYEKYSEAMKTLEKWYDGEIGYDSCVQKLIEVGVTE